MCRARVPLVFAACFACLAAPATASRGVAIDVGRIEISQQLTPGGSYRLPTFGVRNPGDERTSYRMSASALADPERKAVPEEWFEFSPRELTLKPGEAKSVKARIDVPSDADPGDYIALVGAQVVTEGKGTQVGAAAAARTTFSVEPASTLEAWWLELKTFLGDHTPWSWLVPLVALVAVVGGAIRRHLTLSLAVSKRSASVERRHA